MDIISYRTPCRKVKLFILYLQLSFSISVEISNQILDLYENVEAIKTSANANAPMPFSSSSTEPDKVISLFDSILYGNIYLFLLILFHLYR